MPVATRKQIRDSALETTKQTNAQIGSLVEDFINITLQEIGDPAWAYKNEKTHLWSWLKRKTSLSVTSEDTVMERDVDKIGLIRQTATPAKLTYISDELFYKLIPNPTETGNPLYYRLWEIVGLSTRLTSSDTIDIVSSSSSDTSSYEIVVTGYVSGRLHSELYSLNGTTTVSGTTTWDAREVFISKSANTNGTITVTRNSTGATILTISPYEISPRFKVISLWPIPTSNTLYIEYYKRIKELNFDSEMPEFDQKWHHVVRIGVISKIYQYQGKTQDFAVTQELYARLVRAMVASDTTNVDSVSYMEKRDVTTKSGIRLHLSEDVIAVLCYCLFSLFNFLWICA